MNSARSSLSVEDRIPPDVPEDGEFRYPDDWPLSVSSTAHLTVEKSNESAETREHRHVAGITTPPNQFKHHERISSLDSAASRLRSSSGASTTSSPRRNRLSLNFPIQPATRNIASTFTSPRTPTSPVESAELLPTDTTTFLTTLAAQERRVFELKEDLAKAEAELTKLKQQWALLEGTKRRHELLQVEVQRGGNDLLLDSQTITSPTLEERQARRKAAMAKLTQASTQSVTSQKHYRTLSLLSPQRTTYAQPFPQPSDLRDDDTESSIEISRRSIAATPSIRRTNTLPHGRPQSMIETSTLKKNNQDVLMRTGRQITDGFREGLWAFVEDLRQATVGDDVRQTGSNSSRSASSLGTPVHNLRRQGSKGSLRSVSSSGGGNRRAKSPATPIESEAGPWALSKAEDAPPPLPQSARWSTSSAAFSDYSSSAHHHHHHHSAATSTRSSTPRTSTSSVQSSSSSSSAGSAAGPYQGLQLPLWGSVMSASTQFNLKKAAVVVMNSVEKTLAVVAGDEGDIAYGSAPPTRPSSAERRDREREKDTGSTRTKAENVTGRAKDAAGGNQGTTLLRQRSVKGEGARGTTKSKRA